MNTHTPLTFLQLVEQINRTGKPVTIEFGGPPVNGRTVDDLESYPEAGMRALITGGHLLEHDHDVLLVQVDYAPFDDFNKAFETANYYNNKTPGHEANLTAREAGYYKPQDTLYVTPDAPITEAFRVLDPSVASLQTAYDQQKKPHETYTSWLERELLTRAPELAQASKTTPSSETRRKARPS